MSNINYIQKRRNRKMQWLRIRLGILQMIHKPLLNILLIPLIIMTAFIWRKKDIAFTLFNVPQLLFPMYNSAVNIVSILLPLLFLLALIEAIGNITARKDEADLQEAFKLQELRNGCPILMNKKFDRGSNVTMREFYSNIPMSIWIERQEDIADAMNVHFVEDLQYGGKANGKRIVMYTAQGRKRLFRGGLYDEEL